MPRGITIAIPTYKRPNTCFDLIASLCRLDTVVNPEILVIDDGPSSGLPERLSKIGTSRLRVIQHANNRGYSRSFVEIFEEARTEWILILADDDELIQENVSEVWQFLETTDLDIGVPQFLGKGGRVYRGRNSQSSIRAGDLRSAFNHAPGILYRRSSLMLNINELSQLLDGGNVAAEVYPQVVLASRVVANGRATWCPIPLVREGKSLPSNIRDLSGDHYSSVDSRVRQALSFDSFFRGLVKSSASTAVKRRARTFVRRNELNVIWAIQQQALAYSPEFVGCSYKAGTRFLVRQIAKSLRSDVSKIARNFRGRHSFK